MVKAIEYDPLKHGITQGILCTYLECKQKARLWLKRWTPLRTSHALEYGTLSHSVLERVHRLQSKKEKSWVPDEEIVRGHVKVVMNEHKRKNGSRWDDRQLEDFELTWVKLETVLPAYFKHWAKKPLNWMEVEEIFKAPFKCQAGTVTLTGKFDGVFTSGKGLWLYDAKNQGTIDESRLGEILLRNFQINFYMLALRILKKRQPRGFLYTVLRRPGFKLHKNETLKQYGARLAKDIQEDPDRYFKRFEVAIDKEDLDSFELELWALVNEFVNWCKGGQKYQLFGMPCESKYGLCSNIPICYNQNYSPFVGRKPFFPELED